MTADTPGGFRIVRLMGLVSMVCGVLIVTAHIGTLEPIRRNQETLTRQAVAELLPGMRKQILYGVAPSGELEILPSLDSPGPRFFAGYDASGALIGVVIEASERGYADVIKAMYAYSPSRRTITGFKVIELKETPGLGDKIATDPDFLANFKQLDATHPITAVKHGTKKNAWEVDAISGATISSRAVGRMLDKSVQQLAPAIARNQARIEKGE